MLKQILCIAVLCLVGCGARQSYADAAPSAQLAESAERNDVKVLLEHPVLGWTTVDDSPVFNDSNVVYGYAEQRDNWGRSAGVSSFVSISVYPALGSTPIGHCHRIRSQVWEDQGGVSAYEISEDQQGCSFTTWGVATRKTTRGKVDAFFSSDNKYLVIIQGVWLDRGHGILRDYERILESIVLLDR